MNHLNIVLAINRALSDSTRIRIWMLVWEKEVCVCHLVALLKLANSTVSEHLTVLKKAGLITSRKEGKWVYYRSLPLEKGVEKVALLLHDFLSQDQDIQKDQETLRIIQGDQPC